MSLLCLPLLPNEYVHLPQAQTAQLNTENDLTRHFCDRQHICSVPEPSCEVDIDAVHKSTESGGSGECETTKNQSDCTFVENLCNSDSFLKPFSQMLKLYNNMNVNVEKDNPELSDTVFVSGGLQQYLIRTKLLERKNDSQPRKGAGSDKTTFHDLPDSLQLHIFSYLSATSLCKVASVCSHWLLISSDNLLWQRRLLKDLPKWKVISSNTNPDIYEEVQADWSYKDIYLHCSPDVKDSLNSSANLRVNHLTNMVATTVRSFLPKKIPKLAIFGPGLESSTSSIMRKMLEGESRLFTTTGMFPGQFGGIGSGFTMKMKNTWSFNMVVLYTSTWAERNSTPYNQRLQINRLLVHQPPAQDQDAAQPQSNAEEEDKVKAFEVNPSVRDLCRTLNGFIFIIDASEEESSALSVARSELFSMVREMWCVPGAPVVVLSCRPTHASNHVTCIDVVRRLSLTKLNRPWQVHECTVDTMEGVVAAIEWTVETAQRN